ncbi:MAG: tetratricopeptide repeat protein [Planctomycetota bacterium]
MALASNPELARVAQALEGALSTDALDWVLRALDHDEFEELPRGLKRHVGERLVGSEALHRCRECRTLSLWGFVHDVAHCRSCGAHLARPTASRTAPRWRGPRARAPRLLDATPPAATWAAALPLNLGRALELPADSAFAPPVRRATAAVERAAVERLRLALEELEAAPLDAGGRAQLSKDPGAGDVRRALGPPSSPQVAEGSLHLKRGRVADALAAFSAAIRENPYHPQPWTKRGIVRARTGDLTGAVQDYSEALEVDDVYLPAWANRASAEFHRGNLEATVHDASKALELAPKLAQAWLFRGIARAKLGEAHGAEEDLFTFLELSPYSPYVRLIRNTLREVEGRLALSA